MKYSLHLKFDQLLFGIWGHLHLFCDSDKGGPVIFNGNVPINLGLLDFHTNLKGIIAEREFLGMDHAVQFTTVKMKHDSGTTCLPRHNRHRGQL